MKITDKTAPTNKVKSDEQRAVVITRMVWYLFIFITPMRLDERFPQSIVFFPDFLDSEDYLIL